MTEHQIKNGYLKLSFVEWGKHYFLSIYLTFILLLPLTDLFEGVPIGEIFENYISKPVLNLVILGLIIVSTVYKRNQLTFKKVFISEMNKSLPKILKSLQEKMNWNIIYQDEKIIKIRRNGLYSTNQDQIITLIINPNFVLINSISDLDKARMGAASFGGNRQNIEIFKRLARNQDYSLDGIKKSRDKIISIITIISILFALLFVLIALFFLLRKDPEFKIGIPFLLIGGSYLLFYFTKKRTTHNNG